MATANDIIIQAVQRSGVANPDLVPTAQALKYLTNWQNSLYLRAARLNPDYFGASGTVNVGGTPPDPSTAGYDLDSLSPKAAAVVRAEVATISGTMSGVSVGDAVNLINFRNPNMQVTPRAYIRGRKLFAYKTELGSGANYVSALKVYYSQLPAAVTALNSTLSLPDEFTGILMVKLARLFAIRDRRLDELEAYTLELNEEMALFDEAMLAYEAGVTRTLAAIPAIPLPPPSR
jgi:hypothetical protein